jgi:hypothetical protein
MSVFKLALSGDVTQWISPITSWFSGNQISVNLGESGSLEAEAEMAGSVARSASLFITEIFDCGERKIDRGNLLPHYVY